MHSHIINGQSVTDGFSLSSSSAAAERPRKPLSQLIALSCGIKISPVGSLD